jgi:hypothetical protein
VTRFREADLSRIRTQPVGERPSKVRVEDFARPVTPAMGDILDAFPAILAGEGFRRAVSATAAAAAARRPVLAMIGGHVIKTGCSPLLIQLMEAGGITALAMNGAAAIHDWEIARHGATSEDVEAALGSGTFGMAAETSAGMNAVTVRAAATKAGLGEALGAALEDEPAPHRGVSVLAAAHRLGIPATVHVALGTDILHQHRTADGAAIGDASLRDFRILAGVLERFTGGVALNVGSAVILPEVFLKAFSVAANLGADLTGITTVSFDFMRHYRPRVNVVERPTAGNRGTGIEITGHHEILLPLFAAGVLRSLAGESAESARE